MITYKRGDLLDYFRNGDVDVLIHCTNCQTVMGSGIALQIKNELPYAYDAYVDYSKNYGLELGTISCGIDYEQAVINLHAQHLYGSGNRFVNYEALYICLEKAKQFMIDNDLNAVGVPALMAADRAGGSWRVVKAMIAEVFQDYDVLIVEYDQSEKSKYGYCLDEQDVETHINGIVGNMCGTSSHIALSAIEKYIKLPDCNKGDLGRIKEIINKY